MTYDKAHYGREEVVEDPERGDVRCGHRRVAIIGPGAGGGPEPRAVPARPRPGGRDAAVLLLYVRVPGRARGPGGVRGAGAVGRPAPPRVAPRSPGCGPGR